MTTCELNNYLPFCFTNTALWKYMLKFDDVFYFQIELLKMLVFSDINYNKMGNNHWLFRVRSAVEVRFGSK